MKYIDFKDKGFEKALRKALDIKTNKITEKDLSEVIGVCVDDQPRSSFAIPWSGDSSAFGMSFPNLMFDIHDSENGEWLEDLAHLSHIKSLHLYVSTQNLSFLKGFNQLKELYIVESCNKDWSFLESLVSLSHLYINRAHFPNLSSLGKLGQIQEELFKERREEVTFSLPGPSNKNLYFFIGLSHLCLIRCGISDLSPLSDCIYLDEVNLSHNRITNLSPLKSLKRLYYLTMRYNKIQQIESLKDMNHIYLLNLRHNQISDIKPLEDHVRGNLSRLFLEDNPITDFTPIRSIQLVAHDIPIVYEWKAKNWSCPDQNRDE